MVFNDAPENVPDSEIEFARHWLAWGKENKDYLKQGDILFDLSARYVPDARQGDADTLSGFAHIRKDRGYVFLMNPTPQEQIADLKLALDAPPRAHFQVDEVFPGGFSLRGPAEGLYPLGGSLRATVPAKQVRILWIAPASASKGKRVLESEDVRAGQFRRYVKDWTIAEQTGNTIRVKSSFSYPTSAGAWLAKTAPEPDWKKEPWAYDKAYLVLLLNDESRDLVNCWISDTLFAPATKDASAPVWLRINGTPKELVPFRTGRNQISGATRCFFASLADETKPGTANEVEMLLPIRSNLVFSGAYLDLPDQMPAGASESHDPGPGRKVIEK